MVFSFFSFIVLIFVTLNNYILCETQDITEPELIFIDNNADSTTTLMDGSVDHPFADLADAFLYASSFKNISQIRLYIAPSQQPYKVENTQYNYSAHDCEYYLDFFVSKWERQDQELDEIKQTVIVSMKNTTLGFASCTSLVLDGLDIIVENSSIEMKQNPSLFISNSNFILSNPLGSDFITIPGGEKIELSHITVTMKSIAAFLRGSINYFGFSSSLSLQNILVRYSLPQREPRSPSDLAVFDFTGGSGFEIANVSNISFEMEFLNNKSPHISLYLEAIFAFYNFQNVFMANLKMKDQSMTFYNKNWIRFKKIDLLQLDTLIIQRNTFLILQNAPLFSFEDISKLRITNTDFSSSKSRISQAVFSFASFSRVKEIIMLNQTLQNNAFLGPTDFFIENSQNLFNSRTILLNLAINNLTISNNSLPSDKKFAYLSTQGSHLHQLKIENCLVSQNSLSGQIFSFASKLFKANTLSDVPKPFYLNAIKIYDHLSPIDLTFFSLIPYVSSQIASNCLQLIEPYSLFVNDLNVKNNNFTRSGQSSWMFEVSLFDVQETQLTLTNSTISDNFFKYYNFFSLNQKPSTFIFLNNTVSANTFILSQLVNTGYSTPKSFCVTMGDQIIVKTPFLHRYGFILNSTFESLSLISSTLITLNNAFISISNNQLKELHLEKSLLFSSSLNSEPADSLLPRNLTIERQTLMQATPSAWELFNHTIEKANSFDSGHMSFYSISQNKFNSISFDDSRVLSVSGYGLNQGFIEVQKNLFSLLNFVNLHQKELISTEQADVILVTENIFRNFKQRIIILAFTNIQRVRFIQVSSNQISNASIETFLQTDADEIESFQFNGNTVLSSNFSLNFISLKAIKSSGLWTFNHNLIFATCITPSEFMTFNKSCISFISASVKYATNSSSLIFHSNLFSSLSADMPKGMSQDLDASLVSINTFQPITFFNTSFEGIKLWHFGNALQLTNSPSIAITQSSFRFLTYQSTSGLIQTDTPSLLLLNNTIQGLTSIQKSGFILLTPSTQCSAIIENNTFDYLSNYFFQTLKTTLDSVGTIISVKPKNLIGADQLLLNLTVLNSTFMDIRGGYAFRLEQVRCLQCNLENLSFSEKEAPLQEMGFLDLINNAAGYVRIQNLEFSSRFLSTTPIIRNIDSDQDTQIILDNFIFDGKNLDYCLALLNSGTLNITNSHFKNIQLSLQPFLNLVPNLFDSFEITAGNYPKLHLINTNFTNLTNPEKNQPKEALLMNAFQYSYTTAVSSNIANPALLAVGAFQVSITTCFFQSSQNMPLIVIADPSQDYAPLPWKSFKMEINNSTFRDVTSVSGSIITSLRSATTEGKINIRESLLANCSSYVGGAILASWTSVTITDSLLQNNSAQFAGGAIFTDRSCNEKLTLINTTFLNNTAPFGNDTASEAASFNITFVPYNPNTIIRSIFSAEQDLMTLSVSNISDFEFQQGYLILEFVNKSYNPAPAVSTDHLIEFWFPKSSENERTIPASIEEKNVFRIKISLKNLILSGEQNAKEPFFLHFNSPRISKQCQILVELRACLPGEYNNSNKCQPCDQNTYSFSPEVSCTSCLPHANCPGGSQICPQLGFWSNHSHPEKIFQCRNDRFTRCLNDQGCRNCADGYTGILCNACDFENSYVENGYMKCGKCLNESQSLTYSIIFAILYFAYQVFSIRTLYSEGKSLSSQVDYLKLRKTERSYYTKSFMTYTQLISILGMATPEIYKAFGLSSQVGNPSSLILYGTQCSLKALNFNHSDFLYTQTLFVILSPVIQFTAVIFLALAWKLVSKKMIASKFIIVGFTYIILSNQPSIVNNLALFLSCSTLKDIDYPPFVASHPSYSCASEQYIFFSSSIVLPNLVFWSLFIPVAILVVLYFNRFNLRSKKLQGLGPLHSQLKEKYYYWGIVLMVLKLVLAFLAYGLEHEGEIPVFVSLTALWIYQNCVATWKPYKIAFFNKFETVLMNLMIFNIIVARYLLTPSNHTIIYTIGLVFAIIFNAIFLIFVLIKIIAGAGLQAIAFIEGKIMKRNLKRGNNLVDTAF